ncbi:MAG: hypothetical protein GY906_21805 [bacterium]|nr:hypothetical protein [bacterium]
MDIAIDIVIVIEYGAEVVAEDSDARDRDSGRDRDRGQRQESATGDSDR